MVNHLTIFIFITITLLGVTSCNDVGESVIKVDGVDTSPAKVVRETGFSPSCPTTFEQGSAYSCGSGSDIRVEGYDLNPATTVYMLDSNNTCDWAVIDINTGEVSGTPANNELGTCTLSIQITDGKKVATVSTQINVINAPATLVIADTSMNEDQGDTVIRADADVESSEEGFGTYSLDNAGIAGTKCSDNGVLAIDSANGEINFNPNLNYEGACTVRVQFDDGNTSNNLTFEEFTLTVNGINDVPVVSNSCATGLNEDVAYSCAPSVFDPDSGDTQAWSFDVTNTCSWLSINSSTGQISGTPNDDNVGTCTLAFKSNDGTADSNLNTLSVTVTNLQPTLSITNTSIFEDSGLSIIREDANVQASDETYGVYSLLNTTATAPKCSDNGTLSINTSNGAVSFNPATNYNGNCYVKVQFDDQNASNNLVEAEFMLTVTSVNDAPTVSATCSTSLNEDVAYSCNPGVTDPDTGDTQTWSLDSTNTCSWAAINSSTGAVTGTPNDDHVGSCTLAFKSNDGTTDSNIISVGVTVNNVQPTLTITDTTINEDDSLAVIRADGDVQASDESFGVYSLLNGTTTAPKCSDNGTLSIDSTTGAVSFAPTANYNGVCNVKVQFDDQNSSLNTVESEFAVTVTSVNDIPVVSNTCATSATEDILYSCSPSVVDPDTGDTQTWSFAGTNTCSWLSINSSTGAISGTPDDPNVGTCTLAFKSNDGTADSNINTVTITVNNVNDVPVVSSSCATSLNEDVAYNCTPSVVDPDIGDTQTWSFDGTNTCSWAAINSSTGEITGTPHDDNVGSCTLAFKSNDGTVDSNVNSVGVTVNNVQPTLTIADANISEDDPLAEVRVNTDVEASDEGYGVYSLVDATTTAPKCSDNGTLSIDTSTGAVSFAPSLNYNGTCNVKVQFDDQNATINTVETEFAIIVAAVNDAPTIDVTCMPTSSCGTNLIGTVDGTTGALEMLPTGVPDLVNTTLCFVPSGGGYNIFSQTGTTYPRVDFSGHTLLSLGDDDGQVQSLSSPFNFYGTPYSSFSVNSNGYMSDVRITDYSPSTSEFNSRRKIAVFYSDMNPNAGGDIYFFDDANYVVATYNNLANFGTSNSNNAQIEINKTSGEIIINYGALAGSNAFYAGISNAGGSHTLFDFIGGASASAATTLAEDTALSCSPSASDVDGDTLTWSLDGATTCSWAAINSTTGELTGTPIDDEVGSCQIAYKVNDGTVDSAIQTDDFVVSNVAPTLTIADTSMSEDGGPTVVRADGDVQASDETWGLYSLDNIGVTAPACADNGTLSIDANTGAVTFNPDANYEGVCNVLVEFDDGNPPSNTVTDEFAITVNNVNDNPVISSTCPTSVTEGTSYSCTPSVTDPDSSDTQTWSFDGTNTCAWATINSSTGAIGGIPSDDEVGTCTLAFKTNDGTIDSNINTYTITVINGVPQLTIADTSLYQDSPATVIRSDADVQSNNEGSGVYSLDPVTAGNPPCSDQGTVSIDSATGAITYTPTPGYVGDCYVKVVFDDQNPVDNIGTDEFKVTVMDNVGPIFTSIDSSGGDLTYGYGLVVPIEVTYNENVFVDTTGGTPKIKLETGTIDKFAYYVSGSGTNTIRFEYTVGIGDTSADLDVHSVFNNIELSGGTLTDNFNNDGGLALPTGAAPDSLASVRNIVIDTEIDYANFSGQPTRVSAAILLDIDVFGNNLVEYKYKLGDATTVDCADPTGYSAAIPIATNITDTISSIPNGTDVRLCLVGNNTIGNWQPYDFATVYEWTKDKYAITILDFSGVDNIPSFVDAAVAPNNDAVIYARNLKAEMLRSTDSGATWNVMCKLPSSLASDFDSKIHVSAGDDYSGYITINEEVYRIDDLLGGSCLNMTTGLGDTLTAYIESGLTLHPTLSEMYIWSDNTTGSRLSKSIDRGESWTTVTNHTFHTGEFGTLAINPANNNEMAAYRYGADDNRSGFYYSTNAGVNWTFYSLFDVTSSWNTKRDLVWNPVNTDHVYGFSYLTESTPYSANKGTTWSSFSGMPTESRWTFDGAGNIYRLRKFGFDTILDKSGPVTAPNTTSFSELYTFTNVRGKVYSSQSVSVTNSGNTIAVIVENRLYLSTNAGVSFTEINWQGSKSADLHSVTTEDGGQTIYGVTPNWSVVKTTDGGQTWTHKFSYHNHCAVQPRVRVSMVDSNNVIMWPDNLTTNNDCSDIASSTDGMDTVSYSTNGVNAGDTLMAMSPVDQERFFYVGDEGKYRVTKDGGNSWVENDSLWNGAEFLPDSYSHPTISDLVWIGETSGSGILWEYDTQNNVRTNITAGLGLSSFAGFNTVNSTGGQFLIRAISRTGDLSQSTDNGATFTPSATVTPIGSCSKRFLYTHPRDFNVIATACAMTDVISFSRDGGASWVEMNLSTLYGINCDIRGVAIHLSKLFIACENTESIMLNYTPLELVNDVYDGVLSTTEVGNANDLIVNVNAAGYIAIEYAVIPAASTCDQNVTNFSPAIPQSNSSDITADGEYKVCAKLTDNENVDFYETSSNFTVDTIVPAFTSIDLINEATDGDVRFFEHYKNIKPLVGNLVATGFDTAEYALVTAATTCDNSLSYAQSVPSHFSKDLSANGTGTYKVCVKLADFANHPTAFGSSASFTFNTTYVIADLNGAPSRVTTDNALNTSISGTGVTRYKYKVGPEGSTTCSDPTGYGSETLIATNITDQLSVNPINTTLKLCVLGSNDSGDWQPYQFVTEHLFTYSDIRADFITQTGMSLPYWQDVAIAPTNANIIYAKSLFNELYKSIDGGSSWELQCVLDKSVMNDESGGESNLFVSNGPDATGYMTDYHDLYRIDRTHGDNCVNLTSGFSDMYNKYYTTRSAETDTNGHLYISELKSGIGVNIWKSTDQGERFNLITTHVELSQPYTRFSIDPSDPNTMLMLRGEYSSNKQGVYKSTDGGVNWTLKYTSFYQDYYSLKHLPSNPAYVFGSNGYYSTDGGETWTSGGSTSYLNSYRFALDGSAGYRFKMGSGGMTLQKADDMTVLPPVWNDIRTFPKGMEEEYGRAISVNGTKIAVVSEGRLIISNNGGSVWSEVSYPHSRMRAADFAVSKDGQNVYAALQGFRLIGSNDGGESWSYKSALLEASFNQTAYKFPSVKINNLNENQVLMYSAGLGLGISMQSDVIYSDDNFATSNHYTNFNSSTWAFYGFSPNHNGVIHDIRPVSSNFPMKRLGNFGSTIDNSKNVLSSSSYSYTNFIPSMIVLPSHPDTGLAFMSNKMYLYKMNHRTFTDISSNVTSVLSNIAGAEVFRDNDGYYKIRVISTTGSMAVSDDSGASFTNLGINPGLTSCSKRFVETDHLDPNLITTYCPDLELISITRDAGVTWTSYNLADYSINCDIGGVAVKHNKVYVGCTEDYGFVINESPVKLQLALRDSVLNTTELGGANDLIAPVSYPNSINSLRYAIIPDGGTCDGTVTYSSAIPQSNDPLLASDGRYQICIEVTDKEANISYDTTSSFKVDQTAPTFTSLTLLNSASDGTITYNEKLDNPMPIVGNLVGSGFDYSKFAVVSSATTCNSSLTYTTDIPSANQSVFINSGTYKVCVELSDQAQNTVAYGQSATFNYDNTQIYASVSNLPTMVTNVSNLNVGVSGVGLTHYKYKMGTSSTLNCADESGYSAETLASTNITASITGYSLGSTIKVCVIGTNGAGIEQPLLEATDFIFSRNNFVLDYYTFNNLNYDSGWNLVDVAKGDSTIIYGLNNAGGIYKSTDSGTTWNLQCSIPATTLGHLKVSSDGSQAYVSNDSYVYYVFDNPNGSCQRLKEFWGDSRKANFDVYPNGDLLLLDIPYINGSKQYYFYRYSSNAQAIQVISIFNSFQSGGNYVAGFISIDPANPDNIIWNNPYNTSWGMYGLQVSGDGGVSWTVVDPSPSTSRSYLYDPVNSGYIYNNVGQFSSDGGTTFTTAAGYITGSDEWCMDATGRAYHLYTSGSDTILETSSDMVTPVWSNVYTFTGVTGSKRYVSASGTTITAVIGKQLFVSTDGGVSFSEVTQSSNLANTTSIDRVGNTLYASTRTWEFLKSADNGATWSLVASAATPDDEPPFLRISPSNTNRVNVYANEVSNSYSSKTIFTSDGFSTMNEANDGISTWFVTMAISPTDADAVYFLGGNKSRYTLDGGATFTETSSPYPTVWYSGFNSFISPVDNNLVYTAGSSVMYEYDQTTQNRTEIDSRLTYIDPAGMDMYFNGSAWTTVTISRYGILNESTDDFTSFSPIGDPATSLSSCTSRHLKVMAENPLVMVTACRYSSSGSYTTNGGATWTNFSITTSLPIPSSCSIQDLELYNDGSNNHAILSCESLDTLDLIF